MKAFLTNIEIQILLLNASLLYLASTAHPFGTAKYRELDCYPAKKEVLSQISFLGLFMHGDPNKSKRSLRVHTYLACS